MRNTDTPETIYRVWLAPDATLEVEDTGNVVLVTPERRITITDTGRWADQLHIARTLGADAAD